jgi:hypothetical protein
MHYENGVWVDRTVSNDTVKQIICGDVSSFSPFVIFQRLQFPLVVTANDATRQYGSPGPQYSVSYAGFVDGDGPQALPGQLSCNSSDIAASPVGSYVIDCSSSTLSSPKYMITYKQGKLTITPAPLLLTADRQQVTYGSGVPALTYSALGFVNNDTKASLTTQPSLSTTATAASGISTYPIMISGAVDPNYTISYAPGTLIISPAVLTITAPITSKVLNSPNPAFRPTTNGFVNGDTTSVLTSVPSCATTALTTSMVGSYAITCSGGNAANYTFNYIPGTLKIVYSTAVGHIIQPPINSNGSSVFNQGRTIPAKFNVYDANGVSIGTPGVVSSFYLTEILSGTMTTPVQDVVDTNNPDAAFRWDSTAQQWVFNITTADLVVGSTYVYTIALNDGSTITFQYGLR